MLVSWEASAELWVYLLVESTIADEMQYHPVSDLPSFFVHPCNTHEAILAIHDASVSPVAYLLLWIGLIGAPVGLHVPSKLVALMDRHGAGDRAG